jgi:AraC-like DNA-binding protein
VASEWFSFSSRDLPPGERLSAWNDAFGRSISRRVLVPPRSLDGPVDIEMKGRMLAAAVGRGGGSIIEMAVSAGGLARRTPELLQDGNDDIVLHIQRAGRRLVSQFGRDVTVEAGGALLTSNAEPSTIVLPGPARFVCIALPRRVITTLAPRIEDTLLRPLPSHTGVLRLLTTYLALLEDDEAWETPELRGALTTHIYDLCALAAGAARDRAAEAAGRGLRAARLRAVKADIADRLGDADLSAADLARRHGVTPRYIHKLFEHEGISLSRFKLGLRLGRVHGMLLAGRDDLTISEIAYEAGFNDLSTFNREFRRHYGTTPSELRRSARVQSGLVVRDS